MFEQRICELVEGMAELGELMEVPLDARRKPREQFSKLHRKLLSIVREDEVCRHSRGWRGKRAGVSRHHRMIVMRVGNGTLSPR